MTDKHENGIQIMLAKHHDLKFSCNKDLYPLDSLGNPLKQRARWPIDVSSDEPAANFRRFAATGVNMLLATPPGALPKLLEQFNTVQTENVVPKELQECEKDCKCGIAALEGLVQVNGSERSGG